MIVQDRLQDLDLPSTWPMLRATVAGSILIRWFDANGEQIAKTRVLVSGDGTAQLAEPKPAGTVRWRFEPKDVNIGDQALNILDVDGNPLDGLTGPRD